MNDEMNEIRDTIASACVVTDHRHGVSLLTHTMYPA